MKMINLSFYGWVQEMHKRLLCYDIWQTSTWVRYCIVTGCETSVDPCCCVQYAITSKRSTWHICNRDKLCWKITHQNCQSLTACSHSWQWCLPLSTGWRRHRRPYRADLWWRHCSTFLPALFSGPAFLCSAPQASLRVRSTHSTFHSSTAWEHSRPYYTHDHRFCHQGSLGH